MRFFKKAPLFVFLLFFSSCVLSESYISRTGVVNKISPPIILNVICNVFEKNNSCRTLKPVPIGISSDYIRLYLTFNRSLIPDDFEINLLSVNNKKYKVKIKNIILDDKLGFWTPKFFDDQFRIEMVNIPTTPILSISINKVVQKLDENVPLSVIGVRTKPKWKHLKRVSLNDEMTLLTHSIARLDIIGNKYEDKCSSFSISKNMIITNYHCVSSKELCNITSLDFTMRNKNKYSKCIEYIGGNNILDYSILKISNNINDVSINYVSDIGICNTNICKLSKFYILHYPVGNAGYITNIKCGIMGKSLIGKSSKHYTDFGHTCDTSGGSSGSPVFDRISNKLIGLHHKGIDVEEEEPRNRAVLFSNIYSHISKCFPSILSEINLTGNLVDSSIEC